MKRARIEEQTQVALLAASRRRCCICAALESDYSVKPGQIAHLNRNPADNTFDNLVWLCLPHHDEYDSKPGLTKRFRLAEVRRYREELYNYFVAKEIAGQKEDGGAHIPHDVVSRSAVSAELSVANIQIAPTARKDCRDLGISVKTAVEFVVGEALRHPILFESPFSSLPLVFGQKVLLLSWSGVTAVVERVLDRKEAYPLNDSWSSLLALYRKVTLLPYRAKGPTKLYRSSEAKSSLAFFRRLVASSNNYLDLLKSHDQGPPSAYGNLNAFLDEAEFALANDDTGTSVARMEAVLSTVHKFILQTAPRGTVKSSQDDRTIGRKDPARLEILPADVPSILLVDDHEAWLSILGRTLREHGFSVVTALTTQAALEAMVEHDFDLVITDLVMPSGDGREVVLAAKNSSEKTKVIVFTGFPEMSRIADLLRAGTDHILTKTGFSEEDLIRRIRELLDDPRFQDHGGKTEEKDVERVKGKRPTRSLKRTPEGAV